MGLIQRMALFSVVVLLCFCSSFIHHWSLGIFDSSGRACRLPVPVPVLTTLCTTTRGRSEMHARTRSQSIQLGSLDGQAAPPPNGMGVVWASRSLEGESDGVSHKSARAGSDHRGDRGMLSTF